MAHTDFSQMVDNPSVNYSHWDEFGIRNKDETHFLRKGKVGDWENYFDDEMNRKFDIWIHDKNKCGQAFEYQL